MARCYVLRCTNLPDNPVLLSAETEGLGRREGAVCQEHFDRMQAGEPWCVDAQNALDEMSYSPAVILMGDDLAAKGLDVIVGFTATASAGFYAPTLDPYTVLGIRVKTFGADREDLIKLVVTEDAHRQLRDTLPWLDPSRGSGSTSD